jgi:hypothetical protein
MTRYSINGGAYAKDAIAGKPFTTSGSLRGVDYATAAGILHGHALRTYNADRSEIDYVIQSYSTPIAWRTRDGQWTKVVDSFSVTTAKHQGSLYRIPTDRTAGMRHSWLTDTQRALVSRMVQTGVRTIIPRGQERRTVAALVRAGHLAPVVDDGQMFALNPETAERWQ